MTRLAKIGNLVMQETVFFGTSAKDFVVAHRIIITDGKCLARLYLLGEDAVRLEGEGVS